MRGGETEDKKGKEKTGKGRNEVQIKGKHTENRTGGTERDKKGR